jgi:hypothetical protein
MNCAAIAVEFLIDFVCDRAFCRPMRILLRRYKFLLLAACMAMGGTGCTSTDSTYPYFGKERQSSAPPRTSGISRGE